MPHSAPPIAVTVAGSDSSAGAGIQADLKTFTAHSVYGLTVVTCVVAEVPGRVVDIQPLPSKVVCEQMRALLKAYPVAAMKSGMLYSGNIIEAVAEVCAEYHDIPMVVDPVMAATTGDALLEVDAVGLYRECLFPHAALVTPNLDEARVLFGGQPINTPAQMRAAGIELCAHHEVAFLMKGGHLVDGDAVDVLCMPGGETHEFSAPRTRGIRTHGTGCTYSAAIAAGLARGLALPAAVGQAKRYVTGAIAQAFRWEHGRHAVHALNHWPEKTKDHP